MIRHISNADVQYYACWALSNITFGSVDNKTRLVSNGGLDRIYAAMSAHPATENVCLYCVWVISNVISQVEVCRVWFFVCELVSAAVVLTSQGNVKTVLASGGLDRLVAVMAAHISNEEIQHKGCQAIVSLAARVWTQLHHACRRSHHTFASFRTKIRFLWWPVAAWTESTRR